MICGDHSKIKGDAKINLDILEGLNQPIVQLDLKSNNIAAQVETYTTGADMLVDGLFGTGLKGQLSNEYIQLIERINDRNCHVLAVDIPSGLDCDTGQPLGAAIKANYTVTFVAVKKGFIPADKTTEYTGKIYVASIGVEPHSQVR